MKRAIGNRAADSLSPAAARQALAAAAQRVMGRIAGLRPFVIATPRHLLLDMSSAALADLAATIPPAERMDVTHIRLPIRSAAEAVRWVNTVCGDVGLNGEFAGRVRPGLGRMA